MLRYVGSAVLLLHGIIHLLGLRDGARTAAAGSGLPVAWGLAGLLLGAAAVGLGLKKPWWWAVAGVGVLLSQALIVLDWQEARAGTLVNAVIGFGVVLAAAMAINARRLRTEAQTLAAQATPSAVAPGQLAHLPAAARRYLAFAGVLHHRPVAAIYLRQTGRIRTAPDQPWMALTAEQYFTAHPASFLWLATMRRAGVPFLQVQDSYVAGRGRTQVRPAGLLTVSTSQGPEMDLGALQRFLAEAVWFPMAYLQDDVVLTAVDEHAFTATLRTAGPQAAVTLHIDDAGQLTEITARRYRDVNGAFELADWAVRPTAFGSRDGVRVPTEVRVIWKLPAGEFEPIQLTVTELQYAPATAESVAAAGKPVTEPVLNKR